MGTYFRCDIVKYRTKWTNLGSRARDCHRVTEAVTYITHTTLGTVKTLQNASAWIPQRRYIPTPTHTYTQTELQLCQLINELRSKRVSKFSELLPRTDKTLHCFFENNQPPPRQLVMGYCKCECESECQLSECECESVSVSTCLWEAKQAESMSRFLLLPPLVSAICVSPTIIA